MNTSRFANWTIVIGATLLAAAVASGQTTWYVDDDGPNDPGPGDPLVSDPLEDGSADHPFDAIQEGINVAVIGDTVLVLDGEYAGEGNCAIGLGGKAIALRSQNGAASCRLLGPGRVFFVTGGETNETVIQGFTISPTNWGTYGGGMYCYDSSPTILDCVFRECKARNWGGGLLCEDGADPLLVNCDFVDNLMNIYDGVAKGGAGICVVASSPTLVSCRFLGNEVNSTLDEYWHGGGGIYIDSGSPLLINCTFGSNRSTNPAANGKGGAVWSSGSPTLVNCALIGNQADDGAAMYEYSAIGATLINCTCTGNVGQVAVTCWAPTQIHNVVVWGNSTAVPIFAVHVGAVVEYSNVEGGFAGTGNIDADPLFVRMPDPGGDGVWGTDDDDYGDLRLQGGSPCIDAADCTALPADTQDLDDDGDTAEPIPFDLDGNQRQVDDPDTTDTGFGHPCVDMGSYEFQPEPTCTGDLDGDGDTDQSDLGVLLASYDLDAGGDLDGDGDTDQSDLGVLLADYGCAP